MDQHLRAIARKLELMELERSEPGQKYLVRNQLHPRRVELAGLRFELAALLRKGSKKPYKFMILSRPRSGSTLLTRLLAQHPEVDCRGELFNRNLVSPYRFAENLASSAQTQVWGFKALSYQLVDIHRISAPVEFFLRLSGNGWRFLHLRRNTFDQTLSLMMAAKTGRWHSDQSSLYVDKGNVVSINANEFALKYRWNQKFLSWEDDLMSCFPHVVIDYDRQLSDESCHQTTMDQVFQALGVASVPIKSSLRKVLSDQRTQVGNIDDLRRCVGLI